MKKYVLLTLLLCALTPLFAHAQEAQEITEGAEITATYCSSTLKNALDRQADTYMRAGEMKNVRMSIASETPVAAIYVEFGSGVQPFTVQTEKDGQWVDIAVCDDPFAQQYLSFAPQNVHIWQQSPEKADLLVLSAHPDDELLWFGGAIPYYAGEKQMDVLVAYMTCGQPVRRLELLNGLWHCGVRQYPAIGAFTDMESTNMNGLYGQWGREKVYQYLVRLLREHRPEVVLTHAYDGEYGHGAHVVCADAMTKAVALAADASYDAQSAKQYGVWQVKKLYVHKTAEGKNVTRMDWRQPLSFFGGKTGFDIASEAYTFHASQPQQSRKQGAVYYYVTPEEDENSSFMFTLVYSTVGEDVLGGDFFENIVTSR